MGYTVLLWVAYLSVTYASLRGPSEKNATVESQTTIMCKFDNSYRAYKKYWCQGYYRRYCSVLGITSERERTSHHGRLTVKADNKRGEFSVTLRKITLRDAGWYWCGIERPHLLDIQHPVFLRVYEAHKPINPKKDKQGLHIALGIIFGVVLLLLIGLVVLIVKKIRRHHSNSKDITPQVENSIPTSNSVLFKEVEEGVTYSTVTIQPCDPASQDASTTHDKVKTSQSQEAIKPPASAPAASETTEYSTIIIKQ